DLAGLLNDAWSRGYRYVRRTAASAALHQMLLAEVALCTAPPGAHECIVQPAANSGTGQRNQPARPFLGGFSAHLSRQRTRDSRSDAFEELLFSNIFGEVNARGRSSRLPHFEAPVGLVRAQSVEQTEPLNQAQRDDDQKAGVGHQRQNSAE